MSEQKKFKPLIENDEEIYKFWLDKKLFEPLEDSKKPKFSIAIPPPNITGHLHIGHAWDESVQDCMIRYKKLTGFNTCWFSGTDHAGISAQTKFEKVLKQNNDNKSNYSDEEFVKMLFNWCKEQVTYIHSQWYKLGLSLSYNYECFTLDPNIYKLIHEEFIKLYNDKLIYRANKLVNWDCKQLTAISDIEVIRKPTPSKMYYFKYFVKDSLEFVVVATTRPETMFVDTNVFVNPDDERYKHIIGKYLINPINDEPLLVLADKYIDKEFGTGVMKCTPAHDFNDYKLANTHKITNFKSTINYDGTLNENAKTTLFDFQGIDRLTARPLIVEAIEKKGLLVKIEDHESQIGYSERTNEVVEPLLSKQWFVKMQPIVDEYRGFVEKASVKPKFWPDRFHKEMDRWLDNIQDWCISRQLLWGHKIPAWYHDNENGSQEIVVSSEMPNKPGNWYQDSDVLDTWFSSGLWPLAVTKYNDGIDGKFKNMAEWYPVSMISTGWDIIFFWVARMYFQCSYLDKSLCLENVYFHGLIRDENGVKMSKSLGNVIDPMDIIAEYGCDPWRISVLSRTTSGEDINFSKNAIENAWAFQNKILNLSNLINKEINVENLNFNFLSNIDKWIINELNKTIDKFKAQMSKWNFIIAYKTIEDFTWQTFANNYIEIAKVLKNNDNHTEEVISYVYKQILILLHCFAPFTTEKLYQELSNKKTSILLEEIPSNTFSLEYDLNSVLSFIDILNSAKNYRIKNNLKRSEILSVNLISEDKINFEEISSNLTKFNIKLNGIKSQADSNYIDVSGTHTIEYIVSKEVSENLNEKLTLQLNNLAAEIERSKGILSNENFIKRAPESKVKLEQEKLEKYVKLYDELKQNIDK